MNDLFLVKKTFCSTKDVEKIINNIAKKMAKISKAKNNSVFLLTSPAVEAVGTANVIKNFFCCELSEASCLLADNEESGDLEQILELVEFGFSQKKTVVLVSDDRLLSKIAKTFTKKNNIICNDSPVLSNGSAWYISNKNKTIKMLTYTPLV